MRAAPRAWQVAPARTASASSWASPTTMRRTWRLRWARSRRLRPPAPDRRCNRSGEDLPGRERSTTSSARHCPSPVDGAPGRARQLHIPVCEHRSPGRARHDRVSAPTATAALLPATARRVLPGPRRTSGTGRSTSRPVLTDPGEIAAAANELRGAVDARRGRRGRWFRADGLPRRLRPDPDGVHGRDDTKRPHSSGGPRTKAPEHPGCPSHPGRAPFPRPGSGSHDRPTPWHRRIE